MEFLFFVLGGIFLLGVLLAPIVTLFAVWSLAREQEAGFRRLTQRLDDLEDFRRPAAAPAPSAAARSADLLPPAIAADWAVMLRLQGFPASTAPSPSLPHGTPPL